MIVKLYPGFSAVARKNSAAIALWHYARALDSDGDGLAERALLYPECWTRRKADRALGRAGELGLLKPVILRRRKNQKAVMVASLLKAALLLNDKSGGKKVEFLPRPILADVQALRTAATFRAALFSGWHAGRKPNPISRATLQSLTGVSRTTQLKHDRRMGTKTHRNWLLVGHGNLAAAREFIHGACFASGNTILRQFPNDYHSPLTRANRGSTRKSSRTLRRLLHRDDEHPTRFFRAKAPRPLNGIPSSLQSSVCAVPVSALSGGRVWECSL